MTSMYASRRKQGPSYLIVLSKTHLDKLLLSDVTRLSSDTASFHTTKAKRVAQN